MTGFQVPRSWFRVLVLVLVPVLVLGAPPADSKRLGRAKDLIADEQWTRAIEELRAAVGDPKEPSRDEAAFWLAHSLFQVGEAAEALATIEGLEREYPKSRWLKPAGSLRIEIAHRLGREDMLIWATKVAPPAKARPPAAAKAASRPSPPRRGPGEEPLPPPLPVAAPPAAPPRASTPPLAPPPPPPDWWDGDLQIQALGSLLRTDGPRVVPILREIALKADDEALARRAVFVLAQSDRADARSIVIEVARQGSEPIKLTAVKALAQQKWPEAERVLVEVFATGNPSIQRQVVRTLGSAGGRVQLKTLYAAAQDVQIKLLIVNALFAAGARADLERIARDEPREEVRRAAAAKLKLLR
jgi:HEAT repeat protein